MKSNIVLFCLLLAVSSRLTAQATTVYVDSSAGGANNGTSWANAYTMLSTALTAAQTDTAIHVILVARGHYYPTGTQSGTSRSASFTISRGGLKIYGGYPAGGGVRNISAHATFLDGNIGSATTNTDNTNSIIRISNLAAAADSVVLDGFTIQNAYGSGAGQGRGIYINNCGNGGKTAILNCQLKSNQTIGNIAWHYTGSPPVLTILHIYYAQGAGIYIFNSSSLIANCLFSGNKTTAAVTNINNPSIPDSILRGTAVYTSNSSPVITNCTFSGNTGSQSCIFSDAGSATTISNCIVYGNSGGIVNQGSSTTAVSYSILQGSYAGIGNLFVFPAFVSSSDYHLTSGSPARDAGNNAAMPAGSVTDLDGNSRLHNNTVDMGAYEYGSIPMSINGITAACTGSTATLSGTPAGGTFISSNPAAATVSTTTGVLTAISPGTTVITYTASGSSTATAITINPLPVVAPIMGSSTLCEGATAALSNAISGGIWSSSNPAVATVSNTGTVSGTGAGTDTIVYTVTNASGCATAVSTVVTVNALPAVAPLTGITDVCAGSTTTLSSATAGGLWSSTNSSVATVGSAGLVTGTAAGTADIHYMVTANGCSAVAGTPVTVHPLPVPIVTNTGGMLGTSVFASYGWKRNSAVISGATGQSYTPLQNGTYTVTVTDNWGCTGTSVPVLVSGLGFDAVSAGMQVRISPNPVASMVYVEVAEPANIVVNGLDGRIWSRWENAREIYVGNLPDAVYVISIYSKQGVLLKREKLVKVH